MHRCLGILELFDAILSQLDYVDVDLGLFVGGEGLWCEPSADTRTLFSLSRTCKCLSEPALNILWESQDSLRHLLPSDVWENAYRFDGHLPRLLVPWRFTRTLTSEEWVCFEYYSRKVRKYSDIHRKPISQQSQEEITRHVCCSGRFLFPNLTHIALGPDERSVLDSLLIAPGLVQLALIPPGRHGAASFMTTLMRRNPPLESISVDVSLGSVIPRPNEYPGHMVQMISGFQETLRLVRLIDFVDAPILEALAALPKLSKLAIHCNNDVDISLETCHYGDTPFLALQAFHISLWFGLDNIPSNFPLKELVLIANPPESAITKIDAFVQFLTRVCVHSVLEKLGFVYERYRVHLTLRDVEKLQVFSNLQEVNFQEWSYSRFTDGQLLKMGSWWPSIRNFSLTPPKHSLSTILTWRGVLTFLARCKHLTTLRLAFDATSISSWSEALNDGLLNSNLECWHISEKSPIADAVAVAGFFRIAVPQARICAVPGPRNLLWTQVCIIFFHPP